MEAAMRARVIVIAAMLGAGSAALADPSKNAPAQPAPQKRPAQVVLAAAEAPRTPTPEVVQPSPAPKRRIARVTTCRCGDPQADAENQGQ
jgi:hypothetical protein